MILAIELKFGTKVCFCKPQFSAMFQLSKPSQAKITKLTIFTKIVPSLEKVDISPQINFNIRLLISSFT